MDPTGQTEVKANKKAKHASNVIRTETAEQNPEAHKRHYEHVAIGARHLELGRTGLASFQVGYEPCSHRGSWRCALHQIQLRATLADGTNHNHAFAFDGTNNDTSGDELLKAKQAAVKHYHEHIGQQSRDTHTN